MGLAQVFGANVRRRRKERGLTLEAFAHEADLAYTYVGQLERGQRNPTLEVVERIAATLGMEPLELLRGANPAD